MPSTLVNATYRGAESTLATLLTSISMTNRCQRRFVGDAVLNAQVSMKAKFQSVEHCVARRYPTT